MEWMGNLPDPCLRSRKGKCGNPNARYLKACDCQLQCVAAVRSSCAWQYVCITLCWICTLLVF